MFSIMNITAHISQIPLNVFLWWIHAILNMSHRDITVLWVKERKVGVKKVSLLVKAHMKSSVR